MKPRRFGTFEINKTLIEDCPNIVRQLMNNIIVVDARYRMDSDCIVYMGISDMFDICLENEMAPHYILGFTVNRGFYARRVSA